MDLVAGDRVADRLHLELRPVAETVTGAFAVDLDLERDGPRLLELVRRAEDAPGPAGVAAYERDERLSLGFVGALVVEGDCLAAALVDRARPVGEDRAGETVEGRVAVVPALDPPCPAAFALSGGRAAVHVAWTAVVAVARDDHRPGERPVAARHGASVLPHAARPSSSTRVNRGAAGGAAWKPYRLDRCGRADHICYAARPSSSTRVNRGAAGGAAWRPHRLGRCGRADHICYAARPSSSTRVKNGLA